MCVLWYGGTTRQRQDGPESLAGKMLQVAFLGYSKWRRALPEEESLRIHST